MKTSYCKELTDAITNAYRSVIEQKLQEYLNDTGLKFRSQYMTVGVWADDILKQMSLFIRVAMQVEEWKEVFKGKPQVSWDVFKQEIMPALDYTENEDDKQKYDLFCEVLKSCYNSLICRGYEVVRACSR